MKYLTIVRHAKSAHPGGLADEERGLTDRGRSDAETMGRMLAGRFPDPQLVLASVATRVSQTVESLSQAGARASSVAEFHDALYLADAEVIWDFAASALLEHDDVWLVAHNPGVTEAVELLCGARLENVPTLGVVRIAFEEIVMESPNGSFVFFDCPAAHR